MTLVAGVASSTQSCKVVVRDAENGALVREGRAPHPEGTEVDPAAWATALRTAIDEAGGLADVAAVAVGGQQHGISWLASPFPPTKSHSTGTPACFGSASRHTAWAWLTNTIRSFRFPLRAS